MGDDTPTQRSHSPLEPSDPRQAKLDAEKRRRGVMFALIAMSAALLVVLIVVLIVLLRRDDSPTAATAATASGTAMTSVTSPVDEAGRTTNTSREVHTGAR